MVRNGARPANPLDGAWSEFFDLQARDLIASSGAWYAVVPCPACNGTKSITMGNALTVGVIPCPACSAKLGDGANKPLFPPGMTTLIGKVRPSADVLKPAGMVAPADPERIGPKLSLHKHSADGTAPHPDAAAPEARGEEPPVDPLWKALQSARADGPSDKGTFVGFGYEALTKAVREYVAAERTRARDAGWNEAIEAAAKKLEVLAGTAHANVVRSLRGKAESGEERRGP